MSHKPFGAEVTVYLNIVDRERLIQAARERYTERNASREPNVVVDEAFEMIDDVKSALRELIEPDGAIAGIEILDSGVTTDED